MPRTRPSASSTLSVSLCLAIAYSLIVTTICAPFVVPKVYAARRSNNPSAITKAASSSLPLAASAARLSASTVSGSSSSSSSKHREGELIVRFRSTVSEGEKTSLVEGRGAHRQKKLRGVSNIEKLTIPANQDAESIAAELRANPAIEFVEPDYLVTKDDTTPNDPSFAQQWALHNSLNAGADIGVMPAWDTTTGSSSTVIAIIDSGIDFTHPDLANNEWTNTNERPNNNKDDDHDGFVDDVHGWDYVADSPAIKDEQGHGTAIAGIIGSEGNNATGTTGVMWRASLMSLRVLDATGTGDVASAVEAIDYAAAHGAAVINLSWGTDAQSAALADAIGRAGRRGVVVVCSAGNDARDIESAPYYPASYGLPNMVSVAATDASDQLASWSNYGHSHVTVAAPGMDIQTTKMNGGYWTISGTSASAPLVAGVAGLVRTVRPQLSANNTAAAITSSARQVSALTGKVSAGGIVNAAGALAALQNMDTAPLGYGNNGNGGSNSGGGGNVGGNGNGNNAGGNGNGNGRQTPAFQPHDKGHGSRVAPPPPPKTAPGRNLPNLDQARKLKSYNPQASTTIRSNNLVMPECDLDCGNEFPIGGAGGNDPYFGMARNQPVNKTGQPGVNTGSRNFNWGTSLVSLKGRAGMDLNIGISYNSLVWTKQGSSIEFNADHGFPGPGFQLGFPTVQPRHYDSQANVWAYMMVTPAGGRVSMRRIGSSNTYESQDGSYTQLVDNGGGSLVVRTTDGTQFIFSASPAGSGESECTQIKDRNGNFITINYNSMGRPSTVIDTLGRTVTFNYTAQNYLETITQTWLDANNQPTSHEWAHFYYDMAGIQYNFPGLYVVGPANYSSIPVLSKVTFADNSYYAFGYTGYGQINTIEHYAADAHRLAYTSYDLPAGGTAQSDCPRFTTRNDWAENWNNDQEAHTSYSVIDNVTWTMPDNSTQTGTQEQVTTPDGTIYKTFAHSAGWDNGLPILEETWANNARQRWVITSWMQDTSAGYQINPRPTDTNIYDAQQNRKRTHIDYTSYSLPSDVYEYEADGSTVLRRTHTDYRWDDAYVSRRIIGLPAVIHVYDGTSSLASELEYHYDWADYIVAEAPSVQHDAANYPASFTYGRANMVAVRRFNKDAPDDTNQAKWLRGMKYNMAGAVVSTQDILGHQTSISYADSYSDGINRNTLAYPTTVTDPDGYQSTTQYRYDMGAVTHTQTPAPAGQTQGAIQDFTYDSIGRIQKQTVANNGAYTEYVYPSSQNYVQMKTTVQDGAGEALSWRVMDGAGRVRATAADNPNSSGGYTGQYIVYDAMGRATQQSNPTEMVMTPTNPTAAWTAAGDDAAWIYTQQAYDWKGRPTVVTNADGTQRINTYGGCGCAGGEVTTTQDEAGRQKRTTMDVIGRLKKVEELNGNGSVYATTDYTYNVRDQLTQINQAGQLRSMEYDVFGRLKTRTTPEQGATTYDYYDDDTVQKITDARGATQNFIYNARHMVKEINYGAAGGAVATPTVTYAYDAAGNRTGMTDGLGGMSYDYNSLSRLTSETRSFNNVGTYTLSYAYNISGELTSITDYRGVQVGYTHDKVGRVNGVTGANYGGVSSYITSIGYRAFDGVKQISYGNTRTLSLSYNNRLQMTGWNVAGVIGSTYSYNNYGENNTGRVTYAQNVYDRTLDRSYAYDQVGRLTDAFTGSEAQATIGQNSWGHPDGPYAQLYAYDKYGNITQRQGWGGWNASYTASYTGNRRDGHSYDNAGNLINDGVQPFTYDVNNKMVTSYWGDLWYGYDGDGQRVAKGENENGQMTFYLRSSVLGGQVICAIDNSGVWQTGYVYMGGQMLAMQQSGTVSFVHQDPVTKSQRLTDTGGAVIANGVIELDPWGGETGRTSNSKQSHVFTSYERDAMGGMDEAGARKYHGWWSRFDQPDPYDGSYNMSDPQSFNRYSYVQNDPVNFVDPSGLDETPVLPEEFVQVVASADDFIGGGGFFFLIGGNINPYPIVTVPAPDPVTPDPVTPDPLQTTQQRDNRTVCDRMADDAQRTANEAIQRDGINLNGTMFINGVVFHAFNRNYGAITFGSYVGPSPLGFVGAQASGRDVLGGRDYQGDSGFPRNFQDTLNPGEDQVHHFGAYFSAGLAGHKIAPDLHRRDDRRAGNTGDVQLADQARRLGDYLRRNFQQLSNVGNLIRSTICAGGAVPR